MAMIDYGAILRLDGKIINNKMFMDASDTGYICKKAVGSDGQEYDIDGNYFVYAGDQKFLLVFYKCYCRIISDNRIIKSIWKTPFLSETYFDLNHILPNVKVSHLDKNLYFEKIEPVGSWSDYIKENWIGTTGNEKDSELGTGTGSHKWFRKNAKRNARFRKTGYYKYLTNRYIAEWQYNGHKYEVIYGYGIDPDKEVYDEIKYEGYGYTDVERSILDEWFKV